VHSTGDCSRHQQDCRRLRKVDTVRMFDALRHDSCDTQAKPARRRELHRRSRANWRSPMSPRPAKEASRAQLAAEVKRLAEALETEKRRTSEFLAQLAHELRNPLAPILSGL